MAKVTFTYLELSFYTLRVSIHWAEHGACTLAGIPNALLHYSPPRLTAEALTIGRQKHRWVINTMTKTALKISSGVVRNIYRKFITTRVGYQHSVTVKNDPSSNSEDVAPKPLRAEFTTI